MNSIRARYEGLAAVVLATALWGFGGTLAGRLFSRGADPIEVVAIRTWIALAGMAALLAWRRRSRPPIPAGPRPWRAIVGFGLSICLANCTLFLAIDRLPVAVALVLQNLAPACVIAWTMVVDRRPPRPRLAVTMIVALLGVALVVELPTTPLDSLDLAGIGFGLASAAGVAMFSVFGGTASRAGGALTANVWAFAISGFLWLLYQLPHGLPTVARYPWDLAAILVMGLFGTLAPFLLYSWGTARIGAQAGTVTISLEPLFGAAVAWAWLGQALSWVQLAGAVITLSAVIYLQRIAAAVPEPVTAPARDAALTA